jgi:arylsulfatase A
MRKLTCLLGFVLALALSCVATAKPPNIVFILADDVGREVLGCYGGTSYETPNIDRLAAGGIRFQQAYTMPVCHSTRICLLSGQYPFRLGHPDWGTFPRDVETRTLPAVLKRAGYATAVAGKWQLAMLKDDLEQPHRMGFDDYCLYGWHEGPWYYQPYIWQNGKLRADIRDRYGPDVVCDFVIDFIKKHQSKPFFVYYPMSLCHAETNDLDEPAPFGPKGRYDSFAEMVPKMDERVGRVVAALDRLSLRESTLIVYFSDNGTAAHNLIGAKGDHYIYEDVVSKWGGKEVRGGKATLTDWGTRVPLIINWPGTVWPGEVCDDLVDASDFLRSLADVAGAKLPDAVHLDGHSVTAQLCHHAVPRKWVFAEHRGRCFVRTQRWKLYNDGRFYDMQTDPNEKQPLSTDALATDAAAACRELQRALDGLNYRPESK